MGGTEREREKNGEEEMEMEVGMKKQKVEDMEIVKVERIENAGRKNVHCQKMRVRARPN